jgi:5-formyltetrahydrofolate cyclo-ligase
MERQQLRRIIRQKRRALTTHQAAEYSYLLSHRIICHPLFLRAQHIALYLPNDGEPDLTMVIQAAEARGKQCYLPVLYPGSTARLWFAPYSSSDPLLLNQFGIPEPDMKWRKMRAPWSLDLVLMPLVGFDANCNRIGMGGGYYDRTFGYQQRRKIWRKPRLIGTAFEIQRANVIPTQHWDIPLTGVITDKALYGECRTKLAIGGYPNSRTAS